MTRILALHSEAVRKQLSELPQLAACGFGAACCQRLWPFVEVAATSMPSAYEFNVIHDWLEELWLWMIADNEQPSRASFFEQMLSHFANDDPTRED